MRLLERFHLPTTDSAPPAQLAQIALGDKKRQLDTIRLVLVPEVGKSKIYPMSVENFVRLMEEADLG